MENKVVLLFSVTTRERVEVRLYGCKEEYVCVKEKRKRV